MVSSETPGGGIGGVGDGDAARPGGGQVDAVEADADADDELEAVRAREDAVGNRLGTRDQIIVAADHVGDLVFLEPPADGVLDHFDSGLVEPGAGGFVISAEGHRGDQKPSGFAAPAPLGRASFVHPIRST